MYLAAFGAGACKRESPDGTSPITRELPSLVLRDDTPDLLLTYIDERGNFHTTQTPREIPESCRELVRVVVTSRDEGAATELLYVANLKEKNPDGSYAVRSMTRPQWEAAAARRRAPLLASDSKPPSSPPSPASPSLPPQQGQVILYGASWCGPCHEAQAFLKAHGIPFQFHDIDTEDNARKEMNEKLDRARLRKGTIPVIDVKGRMLVGYSPNSLRAALKEAFGSSVAL